jgi:hypothetical protein
VNYAGSATYFVRFISASECTAIGNNKAGKATNGFDGREGRTLILATVDA